MGYPCSIYIVYKRCVGLRVRDLDRRRVRRNVVVALSSVCLVCERRTSSRDQFPSGQEVPFLQRLCVFEGQSTREQHPLRLYDPGREPKSELSGPFVVFRTHETALVTIYKRARVDPVILANMYSGFRGFVFSADYMQKNAIRFSVFVAQNIKSPCSDFPYPFLPIEKVL